MVLLEAVRFTEATAAPRSIYLWAPGRRDTGGGMRLPAGVLGGAWPHAFLTLDGQLCWWSCTVSFELSVGVIR